jgi:uncharacterized protein (DUF302 family)
MTVGTSVTKRPFQGERIVIHTSLGFDATCESFRRLLGESSFPDLAELSRSPITQAEFENQVQARFVGESGFMLFAEFDHGAWLSKFGLERRSVRWIFGNPLIAITMIQFDVTAGLFAPVEMLITEDTDHAGTTVVYVRPSSLMVIEDNPPLLSAARALDAKCETLMARALGVEG